MTPATETLDRTFAALADPTRRAILERLAAGEATVQDLARPFPISLPAVSKHLKVLEHAGLIVRGRRAQWRPAELRVEPLHEAADWLEEYRRLWEGRLDRLDAFLKEIRPDREPDPADPDPTGHHPGGPDPTGRYPAGPDPKGDQ